MTRRIIAIMACLAAATAGVAGAGAAAQPARSQPLDILLTNDDGWLGAGGSQTPLIVALRDALESAGHHVTVVAPGTNQSGQGGRFSLPPTQLQVANPEPDVWTVTPGSPADSVYFALDEIYGDDRPDLVVSGINPGNNMGSAVTHSGTVNAALTALELSVPSVAVSLETSPDWPDGTRIVTGHAADYVVDLVAELRGLRGSERGAGLMPDGVSLNVNYPFVPGGRDPATGAPTEVLAPRGTRSTTVDTGPFATIDYGAASGQAGQPGTYTVGFGAATNEGAPGTDVRAVHDDFVSISALDADRDIDTSTTRWLGSVIRRLG